MQDPSRQLITNNPIEEVSFGLRNWGMPKAAASAMAESALKEFGLSHTKQTHVQRLSKGEKVRLALASVSVLNPDWLILDESLSSLDSDSRSTVVGKLEELRGTGRGILLITHSPTLADEVNGVKIAVEKGGNMLVG
jgi:energy-coupling factor transporter ATP-binding protein EcfA2